MAQKRRKFYKFRVDFNSDVYPSSKYLIKKSVEKFNRQDFEDVAYFEPFYLKDFHGGKKISENL